RHPARSSPSPRPSPATSSGTPVTSASTPPADRCSMAVPPDRAPRSAATAGWVTSPSSAFSDQLQRQRPVRLDGPRVGRGVFVCQRTCADQRRGEADLDRERCLRRRSTGPLAPCGGERKPKSPCRGTYEL